MVDISKEKPWRGGIFELFSVVYNATPPGFLLENGGVWLIL